MGKTLITSMEVIIPLYCLEINKLTPDLFVLLHNKYHNTYPLPFFLKEAIEDDGITLEYLQSEEFIKITSDNEFELRQKAIELFKPTNIEQQWLEFLGTYPIKVPGRNNGVRILKTSNPDAKINQTLKLKYINIIKNKPGLHEHIIKVLNAEMEMRKKQNDLQFMQNIEVWLNQQSFEKYSYLLKQEHTENLQSEYGQEMK